MKKLVLNMTAISSLIFSAASQAAGPSAEIKVIGELIAPTCEVVMPNDGVFDFGTISHTKIQADKPVSLGTEGSAVDLTVSCSAATPLTFKVIDNRLGTASLAGSQYLGLGSINSTGKLGYYTVDMMLPKVDGELAGLFVTAGSTIPSPSGKVRLEQGKRMGWAPSGGAQLAIGKKFSAMMVVEAFLAKRSDMHGGVGEGVNLDGSTTLEFGFGL
ncbi:P pilus assembly protein, pilin FimA [Serratia plymuthica]|nr:P pilus assembly protein, pilin FimA [Serratia plymuthica]